MGVLHYSATGIEVEFDDRVLAHLQLAMGAKLRRGESFFLNWRDTVQVGDGRSSIWVEPSIPLAFSYTTTDKQEINRGWLAILVNSAEGQHGMQLTDEPEPDGDDGHSLDNSMKP
ncbi:DUF7882 family protein [Leifsonia sp. Root112D2]|uniref:DUF7882 family protein n=1 Tax=Leifsonia sp. Root112D2 TaxID=1736426 RepID=UPI0006F6B7AA|nr:hypothetical protein [Leifsonia sp. Root112D2]KQV04983.1 hypothetical protein ASC63_14275 [Leifsonia sp. Root112D2]